MALAIVGDAGTREIVIDLSGTGDLTVRAATIWNKIKAIKLSGETTIANCKITIRRTSTTGPVVWAQEANTAAATKFNIVESYNAPAPVWDGIFVNVNGAWSADSRLHLYTA